MGRAAGRGKEGGHTRALRFRYFIHKRARIYPRSDTLFYARIRVCVHVPVLYSLQNYSLVSSFRVHCHKMHRAGIGEEVKCARRVSRFHAFME